MLLCGAKPISETWPPHQKGENFRIRIICFASSVSLNWSSSSLSLSLSLHTVGSLFDYIRRQPLQFISIYLSLSPFFCTSQIFIARDVPSSLIWPTWQHLTLSHSSVHEIPQDGKKGGDEMNLHFMRLLRDRLWEFWIKEREGKIGNFLRGLTFCAS